MPNMVGFVQKGACPLPVMPFCPECLHAHQRVGCLLGQSLEWLEMYGGQKRTAAGNVPGIVSALDCKEWDKT